MYTPALVGKDPRRQRAATQAPRNGNAPQMRRRRSVVQTTTVLAFGEFEFMLRDSSVWRAGQSLKLTGKASAVLRLLVSRPQLVISKAEFFEAVWPGISVSDWALTTCVLELRQVLGDDARAPKLIETVHRRGYRFRSVVTARSVGLSVPQAEGTARDHGSLVSARQRSVIVGRQAELHTLEVCYERALAGDAQIVFITGEPGIGKTTMVSTLLETIASSRARGRPLIATGQCVEHYGSGEAYLPVLDALVAICRDDDGAAAKAQLLRYAPTWLLQIPALLDEPLAEALRHRVQATTPERMAREMADFIEAVAADRPLVLCLEDLQWGDRSTLELLLFLGQRRGLGRFLLLGTYRDADATNTGHPLRIVKQALEARARCVEVPLRLLAVGDVEQYLARRCQDVAHEPQEAYSRADSLRSGSIAVLPTPHVDAGARATALVSIRSQVATLIQESTEGNPLFMITLVDLWQARGIIRQELGRWYIGWPLDATEAEVPGNVKHLIERQVGGLTELELLVLSAASLVGAEFSSAIVAAAIEQPADLVVDTCEALSRPGSFLMSRGPERLPDAVLSGRYRFTHAVYRRVIADRLPAMHLARLHARIGNAIEHAFGSRAAMLAGELAMHFEQAQDFERALHHYAVAADNARSRLAHREAVALLTKALECLAQCPETPERARQAIALHVSLGVSLLVTDGYSAVGFKHAFERARDLCKALHDDQCFFPVLVGLMRFEILQPNFEQASCLGEELLRLAERADDATLLHGAYMMLGGSSIFQGQFTQAHDYAERSLSLYDSRHSALAFQHGDNPEVLGSCWTALALWYRGYPDQAVTRMDEGVRIAEAAGEPLSLTFILFWSAFLHRWRGEPDAVIARLDRLIPLTKEHGIPHNVALATGLRGWVMIHEGRVEPGVALIREGLARLKVVGHGLGRPFFLALLAEALGDAGDITSGLAALHEAHDLVVRTGERMHLAEIHRLRGELTALLGASRVSSGAESHIRPEEWCQRAIETARVQQARSLELRAAISLARLWRDQAKTSDARRLLAEVEGWFTEGLGTRDRQRARQLLTELGAVDQE